VDAFALQKEDAFWADEPTGKQKRAAEKEAKAAADREKKAQKKSLEAKDEELLKKDVKGRFVAGVPGLLVVACPC
jgi:hypothetical protein